MRTVECRCVTRRSVQDCDHAQNQLVRGAKVHLSWGPQGSVNIFVTGVRNSPRLTQVFSRYFATPLRAKRLS